MLSKKKIIKKTKQIFGDECEFVCFHYFSKKYISYPENRQNYSQLIAQKNIFILNVRRCLKNVFGATKWFQPNNC